jgi:hypothetical protein
MEVPVTGVAAKPKVNEKFFLLHNFNALIAQMSKYMAGVTSSHLFCFLISSSFFFGYEIGTAKWKTYRWEYNIKMGF